MEKVKDILYNNLIEWGKEYCDHFPWRNPKKIYNSVIAEVMLIRTPPHLVLPVYKEFLSEYPTVFHLNKVSLEKIKDSIKGLGLTWRANRLYDMSKYICNNYSVFPTDKHILTDIPGIGDYTAAAIITFYFKERAIMIDSNTVRFFDRFYDKKYKGEARRNKNLWASMDDLVPSEDGKAIRFNESFLDFMRKVCKPKNPLCNDCIINSQCKLYNK